MEKFTSFQPGQLPFNRPLVLFCGISAKQENWSTKNCRLFYVFGVEKEISKLNQKKERNYQSTESHKEVGGLKPIKSKRNYRSSLNSTQKEFLSVPREQKLPIHSERKIECSPFWIRIKIVYFLSADHLAIKLKYILNLWLLISFSSKFD